MQKSKQMQRQVPQATSLAISRPQSTAKSQTSQRDSANRGQSLQSSHLRGRGQHISFHEGPPNAAFRDRAPERAQNFIALSSGGSSQRKGLALKEYRVQDSAPRLGPFRQRNPRFQQGVSTSMMQSSANTTSRRPFMAEAPGHRSRQDRLQVPQYRKVMQMQIGDQVDWEQRSDASSTSLVQSIKSRVSGFWNRMLGRPAEQASTQMVPAQPRKLLVSDVRQVQVAGESDVIFDSDYVADFDERELQKSQAHSFLSIAKVNSINYFSGKTSSHARRRDASAQRTNQSIESGLSNLAEQRTVLKRDGSTRPISVSYQPRVEQSRFTEQSATREAGLKRLYREMSGRGQQNLYGDLSQIKEASQTMNVDEGSEEEFAVASQLANNDLNKLSKRKHFSQDPKEQREAEQQRLVQMIEPMLEQKMAEQFKSSEAMLERFKDSMLEKIFEQSNQLLDQMKSSMPKIAAGQPAPQGNLLNQSTLMARVSSKMSVDQGVPLPMSRAQSRYDQPSSHNLAPADALPVLKSTPSMLAKTFDKDKDTKEALDAPGPGPAPASKLKESACAIDSFLKPPSSKRSGELPTKSALEKKSVKPPVINVVLPPQPTPEVAQTKKQPSSLFSAMAAQGISQKSLFGQKPQQEKAATSTGTEEKKPGLFDVPSKSVGGGLFANPPSKTQDEDKSNKSNPLEQKLLAPTPETKDEKPATKQGSLFDQKSSTGPGLFAVPSSGGLFQPKTQPVSSDAEAKQKQEEKPPMPSLTKQSSLFGAAQKVDSEPPALSKVPGATFGKAEVDSAGQSSAPPTAQKLGAQQPSTMKDFYQQSPFKPVSQQSQQSQSSQAQNAAQKPVNPLLSSGAQNRPNPFMTASQVNPASVSANPFSKHLQGFSADQSAQKHESQARASPARPQAPNMPPAQAPKPNEGFAFGPISSSQKSELNLSESSKKPTGLSIFGVGAGTSAAAQAPSNLFGQQSGSKPGFGAEAMGAQGGGSFGSGMKQPQPAAAPGSALFGQGQNLPVQQPIGGPPAPAQPFGFGQQPVANSMGLFGQQTTPQAASPALPQQPQPQPQGGSLFGQGMASQPQGGSLFGQQPSQPGSTGLFGAPQGTGGKPAPTGLFGQAGAGAAGPPAQPIFAQQAQGLFPNKMQKNQKVNDGLFRA